MPEVGYVRFEEDLKYSIDYVHEKYPEYKILAIGHSFGANILFKYLGRFHENSPVIGAVSVANPFDLNIASSYIKGTVYEGYVTHVRQVNLEKLVNSLFFRT